MQHQVSLNAGETIMAMRKFERIAALYGLSGQFYHGDISFFKSAEFQEELAMHQQTMSFSGTCAHHQNGIAEHAIQQTTVWARGLLLHALNMWPNQTKIDLWSFAVSHAAYLCNQIQNMTVVCLLWIYFLAHPIPCISFAIAKYLVVQCLFWTLVYKIGTKSQSGSHALALDLVSLRCMQV